VASGAVTDRGNVEKVDWPRVAKVLSRRYAIIQLSLSEKQLPGAIVYRRLSLRKYFALFSVADCFFGGTTAGSHLAAAFDVPSIIVIWRSLNEQLVFPTSGHGFKASFLYPQHWFISAEDICASQFTGKLLGALLDDIALHGRHGRPGAIGNHPRRPSGFAPKAPVRMFHTASRRLVRVPSVYGSGDGSVPATIDASPDDIRRVRVIANAPDTLSTFVHPGDLPTSGNVRK
jgi:hypothetical protein